MATGFSATEIISIANCLGIWRQTVETYLSTYDAEIDSDDEDAVRTYLERYAIAELEYGNIHPREANKGFELNASSEKNDLKKKIANLLYMSDLVVTGSRLQRC